MVKKLILFLISFYQTFISKFLDVLGFKSPCRFIPSCSIYTKESIEKYGVLRGLRLGFLQFSRCHPWHND